MPTVSVALMDPVDAWYLSVTCCVVLLFCATNLAKVRDASQGATLVYCESDLRLKESKRDVLFLASNLGSF